MFHIIAEWFSLGREELFDWCSNCHVKGLTYVMLYGVHGVDTVYVLLVRFALAHLKIKFCLASPEAGVAFLQEDYRTHQFHRVFCFLRSMFALIPLFVDFVRYLAFRHHMIQL